jgi:hypothetical protein
LCRTNLPDLLGYSSCFSDHLIQPPSASLFAQCYQHGANRKVCCQLSSAIADSSLSLILSLPLDRGEPFQGPVSMSLAQLEQAIEAFVSCPASDFAVHTLLLVSESEVSLTFLRHNRTYYQIFGLLVAKILGSQREDSTPLSRHDNLSSRESHLVLRKSTIPETLVREFCTADWLRTSVVLDDHDLHIQTSESTPPEVQATTRSQGGNTADLTCFEVQGTDKNHPGNGRTIVSISKSRWPCRYSRTIRPVTKVRLRQYMLVDHSYICKHSTVLHFVTALKPTTRRAPTASLRHSSAPESR